MSDPIPPAETGTLAHRRKELTPEAEKAFKAFSLTVFAGGACAHSVLALDEIEKTAGRD